MKICELEQGKLSTIEVVSTKQNGFEKKLDLKEDVDLYLPSTGEILLYKGKDLVWEIQGKDARNQNLLDKLLERGLPRLCWIAAVYPSKEKIESIVLQIHEFPFSYTWPDAIEIGVDEKIVEALRKERKSLDSVDTIAKWLTEKVIIAKEDKRIVLLSGSPNPQINQANSFRIFGKGIAVDVSLNEERKFLITRVVRSRKANTNDEERVVLTEGNFSFSDYTQAGRYREKNQSLLDNIVKNSDSYLKIWKEYNSLERDIIFRYAREFGWLRYNKVEPKENGCWRFSIDEESPEKIEEKFLSIAEGEDLELEAAKKLPETLRNTAGTSSENKISEKIFSGHCIKIDKRSKTLDIQVQIERSEDKPPENGFIFVCMSADQKRIERRKEAQARIASATCPMPQLGLILENQSVLQRRVNYKEPLSAAAIKAFGGEPTETQKRALEIALNTPDIALIQGPPGTGKTRVIAALQTRLSEISEDFQGISGHSLLTSYQHDAVENVANATQVFGLPAIKIGKKRGQIEENDGVDRWRREHIEKIRAKLTNAELPLRSVLNKVRSQAEGYLKSPSNDTEKVLEMLKEVDALTEDLLAPNLKERLIEIRRKLERTNQFGSASVSPEKELVIKAVRSIRVDPVSFTDDGSKNAYKALQRLSPLNILKEEERSLLQKVADWNNGNKLNFLEELKILQESLLDRISPSQPSSGIPVVNSEVEEILDEIISFLYTKVRESKEGADAVLWDYVEELEHDTEAVRETVLHYTSVLAATCQQSVSYQMSQIKDKGTIFDTVVVDEAARANPLDLFIPMSLAERRIILVGDHRQLPHILEAQLEKELEKNSEKATQEILRKSLFERLFHNLEEREKKGGPIRTVTLDVQYRMHPKLGEFVSKTFYEPYGKHFRSGGKAEDFGHDLLDYSPAVAVWVDIKKGKECGTYSKSRPVEAKRIAEEALKILEARPDFSVGIIAFYSAQVNEIYNEFEKIRIAKKEDGSWSISKDWRETEQNGIIKERLRIGTVDAFQGKEFDIVLVSMTRSNKIAIEDEKSLRKKYGHLMLENRLCVAMSRQKRLLMLFGDSGMLKEEKAREIIPGLVEFYEFCGGDYGRRI